jgi:hypothetical protein
MFEGLDADTAAPLVLAIAAFIASLTACVKLCSPELVKLIGSVREALTVRAIAKTASAHAQRLAAEERRLEAEERRLTAENTGSFIASSSKDREQIESFLTEARREVRECREGRDAEKAGREAERRECRERSETQDRKIAALEKRLVEGEAARIALWNELKKLQRDIDAGVHGDPRREIEIGIPVPRKES